MQKVFDSQSEDIYISNMDYLNVEEPIPAAGMQENAANPLMYQKVAASNDGSPAYIL
jgi:hypothetical protein